MGILIVRALQFKDIKMFNVFKKELRCLMGVGLI